MCLLVAEDTFESFDSSLSGLYTLDVFQRCFRDDSSILCVARLYTFYLILWVDSPMVRTRQPVVITHVACTSDRG